MQFLVVYKNTIQTWAADKDTLEVLAKKPLNPYVCSMISRMNQQTSNRLIEAYNQMMASIRSAFERSDEGDMSLSKAIGMAKDEITHISDLTQDEAEEISNFIKRDINDAAEYMMESSSEFSDWLMLDIEVIERKLIDLFLSVADKTRVELEQLGERNRELSLYYSGEITGPGTLECSACGDRVSFATTSHIEVCHKCGHNTFTRAEPNK